MSFQAQPLALVTGGSQRVGKAVVQTLAAAGFRVLFTFNQSQAQALELEASGIGRAIPCDLANPTDAAATIQCAVAGESDRLDLLVHNASVWQPAKLGMITQTQIDTSLAVHVTSPLLITQAVAPVLRQSSASVVMMIDEMIDRGWADFGPYLAGKSALASLVRTLARELAPQVTVNGISPGVVDWPDDTTDEFKRHYLKRVPLGRPGTPTDVADLVLFLATKGKYITGQVIHLDGGRSVT